MDPIMEIARTYDLLVIEDCAHAVESEYHGQKAGGWMKYLKKKTKVRCPQCGQKLNLKEHFLSDFYIGGFASATCNAILTRDRGIYKKYFPRLMGYEDCLKRK